MVVMGHLSLFPPHQGLLSLFPPHQGLNPTEDISLGTLCLGVSSVSCFLHPLYVRGSPPLGLLYLPRDTLYYPCHGYLANVQVCSIFVVRKFVLSNLSNLHCCIHTLAYTNTKTNNYRYVLSRNHFLFHCWLCGIPSASQNLLSVSWFAYIMRCDVSSEVMLVTYWLILQNIAAMESALMGQCRHNLAYTNTNRESKSDIHWIDAK